MHLIENTVESSFIFFPFFFFFKQSKKTVLAGLLGGAIQMKSGDLNGPTLKQTYCSFQVSVWIDL